MRSGKDIMAIINSLIDGVNSEEIISNTSKKIVTSSNNGVNLQKDNIDMLGKSGFSNSKYSNSLRHSYKKVFMISHREQYLSIRGRVSALSKQIKKINGWFDPKYKDLVDEHEKLAVAMLIYETDNDLLPI